MCFGGGQEVRSVVGLRVLEVFSNLDDAVL